MKESIISAIQSICSDVLNSSNADSNIKRAESVLGLVLAYILAPEELKSEEGDANENS